MSQGKKNDSTNISQFNKFLNNNTEFIKKKYDQHFTQQITFGEVKQSKYVEKTLNFIYDIFNLHKYHSNPQVKEFLQSSLTKNVVDFVEQTIEKNSQREDEKLSAAVSTQLLRYCIEKNDIFAVNYDKTQEKKEIKQEPKEEPMQQQNEKEENLQQSKLIQNLNQSHKQIKEQIQVEQQKNKSNVLEYSQVKPQKNYEKKTTQSINFSLYSRKQEQQLPQVYEKLTFQKDSDTISKHLRIIFQFYCKQQQGVNPKSTFDSINHKCQTMNIGKFMTFANAANILSNNEKQTNIDKTTIVSIFKKIAEGRREIEFHHFEAIIQNLSKKDENVFRKMGIVGSRSKAQILKRLKDINLPFNTKDRQTRQLIPVRYFVPKLTQHSGKVQQSLKQDLLLKKEKQYFETIEKNRQLSSKYTYSLGNNKQDNTNLKFISKLIRYDDNDKVFLKQYQIPDKSLDNIYNPDIAGKKINKRHSLVGQSDVFQSLDKLSSKSMNKVKIQQQLMLPLINKKDRNLLFSGKESNMMKRQRF